MTSAAAPAKPARSRLAPGPWGPRGVLTGAIIAFLGFLTTTGLVAAIVIGFDMGRSDDVGDVFVKVGDVAKYADERLQAAAQSRPLPEPPELLADVNAIKVGFALTLLYEAALIVIVGGTTKETFRGLMARFGLNRFDLGGVWRPLVLTVAGYAFVIAYALAADAIGIDFFKPESTIPTAIVRDDAALAIAGVLAVIAAPISEEFFFRGFVFGGLLKWGFWPAAAVSAGVFTLAHLDPGSIIPFFFIGVLMAYLYWSRGSLWDSLIFHMTFNFTSFALLAAGR